MSSVFLRDREFLYLAVKVGSPTGSPTGLAVKLTITESDQSGSGYAPVKDKLVCARS